VGVSSSEDDSDEDLPKIKKTLMQERLISGVPYNAIMIDKLGIHNAKKELEIEI
jgi:hypothetical protein